MEWAKSNPKMLIVGVCAVVVANFLFPAALGVSSLAFGAISLLGGFGGGIFTLIQAVLLMILSPTLWTIAAVIGISFFIITKSRGIFQSKTQPPQSVHTGDN
eukprot:TRINITY_DN21813_c0_g1_i1.p1 TRINITY_DN21813_c0_g1~~TRINITY_DN21813_c0_g1_i1.p1  ORF type:complete len:102 (+),score=26.91 TRINITY_DN21813_c0_g1_i1:131-436(+)